MRDGEEMVARWWEYCDEMVVRWGRDGGETVARRWRHGDEMVRIREALVRACVALTMKSMMAFGAALEMVRTTVAK